MKTLAGTERFPFTIPHVSELNYTAFQPRSHAAIVSDHAV